MSWVAFWSCISAPPIPCPAHGGKQHFSGDSHLSGIPWENPYCSPTCVAGIWWPFFKVFAIFFKFGACEMVSGCTLPVGAIALDKMLGRRSFRNLPSAVVATISTLLLCFDLVSWVLSWLLKVECFLVSKVISSQKNQSETNKMIHVFWGWWTWIKFSCILWINNKTKALCNSILKYCGVSLMEDGVLEQVYDTGK